MPATASNPDATSPRERAHSSAPSHDSHFVPSLKSAPAILAFLGLFSAAVAALSLIYNWCYASELGLSLSLFPSASEDFTGFSAKWLLPVLSGMTLAAVLFVAGGGFDEPDEPPRIFSNAFNWLNAFAVVFWLCFTLAGRCPTQNSVGSFLAITSWCLWAPPVFTWRIKRSAIGRSGRRALIVLWAVVAAVLFINNYARREAIVDLGKSAEDLVFTGEGPPLKCRVLRRYANFYLVQASGSIAFRFIPEREVRSVDIQPNAYRLNQFIRSFWIAGTPGDHSVHQAP